MRLASAQGLTTLAALVYVGSLHSTEAVILSSNEITDALSQKHNVNQPLAVHFASATEAQVRGGLTGSQEIKRRMMPFGTAGDFTSSGSFASPNVMRSMRKSLSSFAGSSSSEDRANRRLADLSGVSRPHHHGPLRKSLQFGEKAESQMTQEDLDLVRDWKNKSLVPLQDPVLKAKIKDARKRYDLELGYARIQAYKLSLSEDQRAVYTEMRRLEKKRSRHSGSLSPEEDERLKALRARDQERKAANRQAARQQKIPSAADASANALKPRPPKRQRTFTAEQSSARHMTLSHDHHTQGFRQETQHQTAASSSSPADPVQRDQELRSDPSSSSTPPSDDQPSPISTLPSPLRTDRHMSSREFWQALLDHTTQ